MSVLCRSQLLSPASFCGLWLLFTLLNPGNFGAYAADTQLVGAVTAKTEYNDNLQMTEENREEDFVTVLTPMVKLTAATERSKLQTSAILSWIKYSQQVEQDNYDAELDTSYAYNINLRTSVQAALNYKRDTRSDRDFTETGLVYTDVERDLWRAQLSARRSHSERVDSSLSYAYQGENYASGQFDEASVHALNYGLFYSRSERETLRVFLGYDRRDYDRAAIDNVSGTLGEQWRIDEKWDFSVDLGASWTQTKREVPDFAKPVFVPPFFFTFATKTETTSEWGAVLKAALNRKTAHGALSFNFSHDQQTASGSDKATRRTAVNSSFSHRFDRSWSGRLSGGYFINKSIGDSVNSSRIDEQSLSIRSALRYEFDPELAVELSYQFSVNDDAVANRTAYRNQTFLQVQWSHSMFSL